MKPPALSIVLPVFEERDTISDLIGEIVETLQAAGLDFEIVSVDDGSQDGSPQVLRRLQDRFPGRLYIVRHLYNKGNGAALRTGIRVARGEIVVTMDADGQHAAADILTLIEKIPPYDLVIGSRTLNYEGVWHRNLANSFYNRFASWLSRRPVLDLTSGFRAMRREVVRHFLPLFPAGFSAPTTTTMAFLKAGYNVAFVPIHVRERAAGVSKIKPLNDGVRFVLILLRMIMLYDPLRIFFSVSLLMGFLGILAGVAGIIVAGRLVLPNSAILLFIVSLMTFLLGLIASQISSTMVYYHGDETVVVEDGPARDSEPVDPV
jgi:glycosyltransferase involved in cell wall biosynthesis